MKFLIIPDSFKNCLTATEVGTCIEQGLKTVFPDSEIKLIPIADGGEGTVYSIISAVGGKIIKSKVNDPLGRLTDSFYGILLDNKTAVIEMAAASGIELISSEERDVLNSNTYGTGQLIKKAIDKGCTRIIIGIGGSATNDGGIGMAAALGVKFLNKKNDLINPVANNLSNIAKIDFSELDQRIKNIDIEVASDVVNPLCGKSGATLVFSEQKGADLEMKTILENGLLHLGNKINTFYSNDIFKLKGGGAAGGLGAGLVAFLGAQLKPGFSLLSSLLNIEKHIKNADVIISAEGKIDFQTTFGKAPISIAEISKKFNKPIFIFAGSATEDASNINHDLIDAIVPITRRPVLLDEAIQFAPVWLKQSAIELAYTLKAASNLT